MNSWRWLAPQAIFAIHARQLAEHGGLEGTRDEGAVEAAIARPRTLAEYGQPDVFDLAASYAWGILRNHGFVDGNKRTAWIAARLFLADNGVRLSFDKADAVRTVELAAAGQITEAALAEWFRARAA